MIWEFRAEGTGYPNEEVRGKVRHYPWPDHHPPPFAVVPLVMAGMRNWLAEGADHGEGKVGQMGPEGTKLDEKHPKGRVVVVHCKAGKGRSGTMASAYLISECGWTKDEALTRFTERRMRPGFGSGVSIPSQLRWVDYIDRWTRCGKKYVSRPVEIMEIHVWGLREGVKVAIESFVDDGKRTKCFHVFKRGERLIVEGGTPGGGGFKDWIKDMADPHSTPAKSKTMAMDGSMTPSDDAAASHTTDSRHSQHSHHSHHSHHKDRSAKASATAALQHPSDADRDDEAGGAAVVFKPSEPLIIPTSDINIDFERRNKVRYGMTMVTSVAHVWFNPHFEGKGPEQGGVPDDNGVFEIEWDKMDGIKGSLRKGTRALDRLAVVWRFAGSRRNSVVVHEPGSQEDVRDTGPTDWKGGNEEAPGLGKDIGIREESPGTRDVSKASSTTSRIEAEEKDGDDESVNMVKGSGPDGEEWEADSTKSVGNAPVGPVNSAGQTAEGAPRPSEPTVDQVNQGLDTATSTTGLMEGSK